ncbi:MAG: transketolase family protein [Emcibacteraceae bacterium]|nr:transketolase family protein [Emcibacteraceae bacterium]
MEITERNAKQWARLGPRGFFGQAMLDIAEGNPNIIAMSADLGSSSGLERFKTAYPDQFVNAGIAEQNMIGVAGGLAKEGFNVFATSFSPFIAIRAGEQVRMNLGYMHLNVKAVAIGAGINMGFLGNSHFGLEDLSLMRAIPKMTIISPADCGEVLKTVQAAANFDGPMYIRLTGDGTCKPVYLDDYDFQIGKSVSLREGSDVTIVACGSMVKESLDAADLLAEQGIEATVINMHTIKPLDHKALDIAAEGTPAIVTVEEHSTIGGLGSCVSEYMAPRKDRVPHLSIGLPDEYIKTGSYRWMLEQQGLLGTSICTKIADFLKQ